jgi:hypothetical protein
LEVQVDSYATGRRAARRIENVCRDSAHRFGSQ